MRTYHFLNAPAEALALVRDPELDGMFDQLVTYQILMDLLYQNEMYQDVLDLLEVLQEKQVQGVKFPKNAVVLAMASCWKMVSSVSICLLDMGFLEQFQRRVMYLFCRTL